MERDELQYTFPSVQHDEGKLGPVQSSVRFWTLFVTLYHSGDCLETDKNRNDGIKHLTCYHVKDESLELVLWVTKKKKAIVSFLKGYIHIVFRLTTSLEE